MAILINKKVFARDVFRTIFFVPLAVSFVAAGIIFSWILTTTPMQGFLPDLFAKLGLDFPLWQTTNPGWAMVMIVVMNTWKSAGYAMVIYLAGLQGINPDYEAARSTGSRLNGRCPAHHRPPLAPQPLTDHRRQLTVRGFELIRRDRRLCRGTTARSVNFN
jgi:multiple sugar transport system permease protein